MAFTTLKNFLSLTFRDIRDNERRRSIELGGLVLVTDDDANLFHKASKSAVVKYVQNNYQRDDALVPDADSEVRDTLRLYFRTPDQETVHLDIPDPHDELFLSTTGAGANILKDKADLDAADPIGNPGVASDAMDAVGQIIDKTLAGDYLLSDGETVEAYLSGERVTWR